MKNHQKDELAKELLDFLINKVENNREDMSKVLSRAYVLNRVELKKGKSKI